MVSTQRVRHMRLSSWDSQLLGERKRYGKSAHRISVRCVLWQVMHERVWASECLQSHGLDSHGPCALCSQEVESLNHLFVGCSFSREIWFKCLHRLGLRQFTLTTIDTLLDWWLRSRKRIAKLRRKAFDSFVFLVSWKLWLERNARVFRNSVASVSKTIFEQCNLWCRAGLVVRLQLLGL
jgi:hypothetical protein